MERNVGPDRGRGRHARSSDAPSTPALPDDARPAQDYETDAEGRERFAYDGEVYEGRYHVNPILWDAYRSLFALHNIINRAEEERYVQSLMRTQELTGWWPSGHVMIGNHAISVLADAWAKGIRTFDPEEALGRYYREITRSAVDTLNNGDYNREHVRGYGRLGFEDYFAMGYIPYPQGTDRVMETTSKTIEYNYDDFCAWRLARMTGNDFYERIFARHIYNYRNVFDPADGFFKGRDREGRFDEDFNPYEWGGPFVGGQRLAVALLGAAGRTRHDRPHGRRGGVPAQPRRAVRRACRLGAPRRLRLPHPRDQRGRGGQQGSMPRATSRAST